MTLTYNLHFRVRTQPASSSVSVRHLPLYDTVREALRDRQVFPPGIVVGFHCQHAYPRSRLDNKTAIEVCLKGIDRALLLVLRSLGLEVGVRPVIDHEERHKDDEEYVDDSDSTSEDDDEMASEMASPDGLWWKPPFNAMLEAAKDDACLPRLTYDAQNGTDIDADGFCLSGLSFQERLENILTTRRIEGLKQWQPPRRAKPDYVGSSFEVDLQGMDYPEDEEVRVSHCFRAQSTDIF